MESLHSSLSCIGGRILLATAAGFSVILIASCSTAMSDNATLCLINEGYELPEPPSKEAWLEGASPYSPFKIINRDDLGGPALSNEENTRLIEACPPSGEKYVIFDGS